MGFLLFAARKLQLKRQINQLSYRNMQLNQEQETVSQKIKNLQQAQQAAQNQVNIFATKMNSANQIAGGFQQLAGLANGQAVSMNYMGTQMTPATMAANVMNSIFTAANQVSEYIAIRLIRQAQLAELNAKDSEISLELENNDSQLELLQNEYQSVKKAESNEAQNCVSNFGLA